MSAPRAGRHRAVELRSLHLLDLENMVGGVVTPATVAQAWADYVALTALARDDAVIVATAQKNAAVAAFGLPSTVLRVVGDNGRDGADIALAQAVDVPHAAARYDRVFIASCDGYFAPVARAFSAAGCAVAQVIGPAHVSTDLYLACSSNLYLRSHAVVWARSQLELTA